MRVPIVGRSRELAAEVAELKTEVSTAKAIVQDMAALYAEDVGQLERNLYEPGWVKALTSLQIEFSAEGLRQLRAVCLLYAIKNPLIKRGLALRAAYVWGRGVSFTARSNGKEDGEQDVQAVVDAFLNNEGNREAFTGAQARIELETFGFGTEGELYVALFTSPVAGTVQVRTIIADEIVDVITDPDDRNAPRYYHRRWQQAPEEGGNGEFSDVMYPALWYRPAARPAVINGVPVRWDAPMLHRAVNRPHTWKRGIPDSYAAVDWAKAYRIFLEDWAVLMRALAQYAYQTNVPAEKAGAMRRRLAAPVTTSSGEPSNAGRTLVVDRETALTAVSKTGATFDSGSGRPLAAMAASALEVPVTMLLADPGTAGARATAETLDTPTELAPEMRRGLWADIYQSIFRYVIMESVRAPQGALKGKLDIDDFGAERVTLRGETSAVIDVKWPAIDSGDVGKLVDAIMKAWSIGVVPPEVILKLIADALGIEDIGDILDQLIDEDGNFKFPKTGPDIEPSPADLARAGADPAGAGAGRMGGDDPETKPVGGNPNGARSDGS